LDQLQDGERWNTPQLGERARGYHFHEREVSENRWQDEYLWDEALTTTEKVTPVLKV